MWNQTGASGFFAHWEEKAVYLAVKSRQCFTKLVITSAAGVAIISPTGAGNTIPTTSLNYWFRSRRAIEKVYELEQELKRSEYAGKPTKKKRKLDQFYNQTIRDLSRFDMNKVFPERK